MIGAITAGLFSAGTPAVTNSYESIATATLSSAASTISFTSIPSTFKHLQIRGILRDTRADYINTVGIRFNSDSGSNYPSHTLWGDGANKGSYSSGLQSYADVSVSAGSTVASNIFGATVIDILDYTDTNKNKTVRALAGMDANGSGEVRFSSGLWLSTTAINSITLYPRFGTSPVFSIYSSLALYGIKG
jgi:hypothetical protein